MLDIIETRGKMHNPVTGSGGMLIGTVAEVGPDSPLGLQPGERVATLVSLTLTPLRITDDLAAWDGLSEQVPAAGHAILFGRSIAAALPDDLPDELALAVLDVCGAPALTARVVKQYDKPTVAVIGAAGKSGSLALAAARRAGAAHTVGVVPVQAEADRLAPTGLADDIALADARDPVALAAAIRRRPPTSSWCASTSPAASTARSSPPPPGGTVIFFSMATSFSAAALGAEGLAADVTMLIGNGYVPGHAGYALDLLRADTGVQDAVHRAAGCQH